MIIIKEKLKCSGCHSCSNACPVNCIKMQCDDEGFMYPQVDADKCINCDTCEKSCPIINFTETTNQPKVYASYNKNEYIRENSSSGGLFTLIAEYILNNGGVVFGARFDRDFNVIHLYTDNQKDLARFRGSKYVQSIIGDAFLKVKDFLDNNRIVLFTGTPCQIGGLLAYLKKDTKFLTKSETN